MLPFLPLCLHGHRGGGAADSGPFSTPIVGTHPRCAATLSAYRDATTRARGWLEAQRLAGLPSPFTVEKVAATLQSDVCEGLEWRALI